ncbi:undecaprenyldiphospho-muramoylpentapeptide beta-N-acetylglucosaminyltransferase [Candidiatus Paracoxiella cheracis]|uniref:undecaprenyldiphospho-muramoylpentapeptide beta-N-acetylglucosaminyltransferase n=1 Tax=Candidiatus Paracoxiella cheracis TaxID=3405120 RepID=UPI003BF58A6F
MKRILIIAGGTGGHIFPALAVAQSMYHSGVDVYWLGSRGGLEERLVPSQFPMSSISIKALRGKGPLRKLLMPWQLLRAIFVSYQIIRRLKPEVVLGMGGYVSGPGGIAAWMARVPLIIHEQNSIAGLTNRLLSKFAKTVLQAFPETFHNKLNVETTGNPVRQELIATPSPRERFANRQGPLRVLVLGGSQGARPINQHVIGALAKYPNKNDIIVWHQTGQADYDQVLNAYNTIPVEVKVSPFIEEIAHAYCWADIVICRAGALTVSEIATVGVGAIFIPYPYAVDNHQFHNSRYLEQAGAAIIIMEASLSEQKLIDLFQQFSHDRNRLLTMAECARHLSQPKAVEHVVAECHKLTINGLSDGVRR